MLSGINPSEPPSQRNSRSKQNFKWSERSPRIFSQIKTLLAANTVLIRQMDQDAWCHPECSDTAPHLVASAGHQREDGSSATTFVWALDVSGYRQNLENWPRETGGLLPALSPICGFIQPFPQDHSPTLWLLGGAIIREPDQTPSLRKVEVERVTQRTDP